MTRGTIRTGSIILLAFGLTFALRLLTVSGLGSDDHFSLWSATAILHGDLPLRDFDDLGVPLYVGMSTLAQAVVGYRPLGEVLLGSLLVAIGLTLTFSMGWAASRSLVIASVLTAMAVLPTSITKLYSYPKMFLYPLGAWLCWRYIDKPDRWRLAMLGLGVAFAFGYRHDHGFYLGIGAALALLTTHWPEGFPRLASAAVRLGVIVLLLVSPFLAYAQVQQGLLLYFGDRVRTAQRLDSEARQTVWFNPATPGPAGWFVVNPPPAARVQIDWKPEVTAGQRAALEARYGLTQGLAPKQQLYEYEILDPSPAMLTRLMAEKNAIDVKDIPAVIGLEWHPSAANEREGDLEGRYHLSNPRRDPTDASGRRMLYDISDVSQANLRELTSDAHLSRWDGPRAAVPAVNDASEPQRVRIQWHADVTDAVREEIESTYGLRDATPGRNRWEYVLTDASSANIQQLVEDPSVSDTGLIHRDTYEPMEETWWIRAQRAFAPLRVRFSPDLISGYNTGVFLHYTVYSLPLLVLAMLAVAWLRGTPLNGMPNEAAKMLTIAGMMAIAHMSLLRRMGYYSDHVAMASLFGAWLLAHAIMAARRGTPAGIAAGAAAGVAFAAVLTATVASASPIGLARTIRLDAGLSGPFTRGEQLVRGYSVTPPIDAYAPPNSSGGRAVIRYLYECTRPDDRLWILSDLHTFPYYAERRIVGHMYWARGFMNTPEYERKIIARLEGDRVPLVVELGHSRPFVELEAYPALHEYASKRYTQHYTATDDDGSTFWISTDSRRTPTGTYERLGLPCFK